MNENISYSPDDDEPVDASAQTDENGVGLKSGHDCADCIAKEVCDQTDQGHENTGKNLWEFAAKGMEIVGDDLELLPHIERLRVEYLKGRSMESVLGELRELKNQPKKPDADPADKKNDPEPDLASKFKTKWENLKTSEPEKVAEIQTRHIADKASISANAKSTSAEHAYQVKITGNDLDLVSTTTGKSLIGEMKNDVAGARTGEYYAKVLGRLADGDDVKFKCVVDGKLVGYDCFYFNPETGEVNRLSVLLEDINEAANQSDDDYIFDQSPVEHVGPKSIPATLESPFEPVPLRALNLSAAESAQAQQQNIVSGENNIDLSLPKLETPSAEYTNASEQNAGITARHSTAQNPNTENTNVGNIFSVNMTRAEFQSFIGLGEPSNDDGDWGNDSDIPKLRHEAIAQDGGTKEDLQGPEAKQKRHEIASSQIQESLPQNIEISPEQQKAPEIQSVEAKNIQAVRLIQTAARIEKSVMLAGIKLETIENPTENVNHLQNITPESNAPLLQTELLDKETSTVMSESGISLASATNYSSVNLERASSYVENGIEVQDSAARFHFGSVTETVNGYTPTLREMAEKAGIFLEDSKAVQRTEISIDKTSESAKIKLAAPKTEQERPIIKTSAIQNLRRTEFASTVRQAEVLRVPATTTSENSAKPSVTGEVAKIRTEIYNEGAKFVEAFNDALLKLLALNPSRSRTIEPLRLPSSENFEPVAAAKIYSDAAKRLEELRRDYESIRKTEQRAVNRPQTGRNNFDLAEERQRRASRPLIPSAARALRVAA